MQETPAEVGEALFSFNSLSRDHSFRPAVLRFAPDNHFQLPLSGSLGAIGKARLFWNPHTSFNSLSRDHWLDAAEIRTRTFRRMEAFNSLSRDHYVKRSSGRGACDEIFQLPLSGSQDSGSQAGRRRSCCFQLPLSGSRVRAPAGP